ncbi:cyclic peptide export ABC transporter [Paraneptunicella aestuarii]|uniref:cyclic peptide export ABC transporter n=1 Tax=Paraneptunicella aestuarii TaxID=2831148 RepID=UPI001E5FCE58|nr:cyclic peptide export ABC transporter [Paraneptunicella aestuarii]UAA37220.1 cyclic peptide export ABC transporter [Paraneptunicella aestuarii]
MKLFEAFTKNAPNMVFISMLLGAIAGICYSMLIPIILKSIGADNNLPTVDQSSALTMFEIKVSNPYFALLFLAICVIILIARTASQILLVRIATEITNRTRLNIYRRILKAPIDELDKLGSSRTLAVITGDVSQIVDGAGLFPGLLVNSVTLVGLLGFLLFLNTELFWVVILAIVFGGVTYQIPLYIGNHYFRKVRKHWDYLYESMLGLVYGTKELKLNKAKREAYYNEILSDAERLLRDDSLQAETIVRSARSYGDLVSFFVIGFVAFVYVNYNSISTETLIGVIMAMLYITGPITAIMNTVPQLLVAKVALGRVNEFIDLMSRENASEEIIRLPDWKTVRYSNLTYRYEGTNHSFQLGPIDMELAKGEIAFIVGGNGSGKSTLCKLIALHYPVHEGDIYFGNTRVDQSTLNSCREAISAIFTDFYLFDRLLGSINPDENSRIQELLNKLGLDKKVKIENGKFSTISLSDGQKKRLALLVEMLEDRDLYIFDEWAADQDPSFKIVFYKEILPELKARGKMVVVISHDDRFFDIADKIIVMDEGKIKKVQTKKQLEAVH